MSISSGCSSLSKASGVPQRGQKVRAQLALDAKRVGAPDTTRYSARGTENQATVGAPAARRHMEQWHTVG